MNKEEGGRQVTEKVREYNEQTRRGLASMNHHTQKPKVPMNARDGDPDEENLSVGARREMARMMDKHLRMIVDEVRGLKEKMESLEAKVTTTPRPTIERKWLASDDRETSVIAPRADEYFGTRLNPGVKDVLEYQAVTPGDASGSGNAGRGVGGKAASRIRDELKRLEQAEDVTILYACESGSRAWGFESEDSDYDVRFIYVRRTRWYLTIQEKRDVIEKPIDDELDVSGWDATKALQLLRKSNPPLLEWLQSPIVYVQNSAFVDRLRGLLDEYYSPIACMHHYLHMAENNFRTYLKDDEVWTKKYFYVLRPVLACIWIERGFGVVPIEFGKLVSRVVTDGDLLREIDTLLRKKRAGAELDRGPRNTVLSGFLERELKRLKADAQPPARTRSPSTLDRLFVDTLIEVNGEHIEG